MIQRETTRLVEQPMEPVDWGRITGHGAEKREISLLIRLGMIEASSWSRAGLSHVIGIGGRRLPTTLTTGRLGGGLYVLSESSVAWRLGALFSNNTAEYGSVMRVRSFSAVWNGNSTFARNRAADSGGALWALYSASFFSLLGKWPWLATALTSKGV